MHLCVYIYALKYLRFFAFSCSVLPVENPEELSVRIDMYIYILCTYIYMYIYVYIYIPDTGKLLLRCGLFAT